MNYAEIGFLMHFHILIKLCRPQCPFKLTYGPLYTTISSGILKGPSYVQDAGCAHCSFTVVVLRFISRDYEALTPTTVLYD